ncbi:MAG: hypothetical protein J6D09_07935 [Clostridia bacterium]|nr:hypothetical protein [Clostridia bacterium]
MTKKQRTEKRRSVRERWQEYERGKHEIDARHLSQSERDKAIRKLVRKLKL